MQEEAKQALGISSYMWDVHGVPQAHASNWQIDHGR